MRKSCKRKVWSTNINPIAHAIAGAAVSDKQSLDKLRLCELSAIDAMTKGMGTTEDWRWLADVINIAETMGKGRESEFKMPSPPAKKREPVIPPPPKEKTIELEGGITNEN